MEEQGVQLRRTRKRREHDHENVRMVGGGCDGGGGDDEGAVDIG